MYKLIAVDMDGTLLRKDKTISSFTQKAICKARHKGVRVVLASGRPIEGLQKYLEELNLVSEQDYVLSFNGSIIQNTATREVIKKNILTGKDLHELYALSQQIGLNIHAFSNAGCITPKMSKYSELEGTINGIPVLEVDYSLISQEEDIIKVMMIDEPSVLEEGMKKLPTDIYDKYTIVKSAPYFLEFINKKAGKGAGVRALAEYLGIKQEEIICIGDAGNDLDMIQFAGLGVAMGNAFEEVKEAADFVTACNDEDGVAHVIEKFILAV
ncbi:sugar-phosphatase [Sporanaerobium hydrogeniformans]|uniref:Sugar-phosphatase n=1 Tax=Sporanaerobium hydrogeniformans TaxID=3072179 RepID=A0AC61DED1_9FIRM|nr:sugar-phosphatase [Sporanaerobium hydrogeniformans]PHV71629.1 sugar-phosphatase [Sporanaerobium hydrogeniformans]